MSGQVAGTRARPRRTSFLVDNGRLRGLEYATAFAAFSLVACFSYGRIYDRQLNAISGLFVQLTLVALALGAAWYIKTGTSESNYKRQQVLAGFMQAASVVMVVTVIALVMVKSYHSSSDWTISAVEALLVTTALCFAATCVQAFRRH